MGFFGCHWVFGHRYVGCVLTRFDGVRIVLAEQQTQKQEAQPVAAGRHFGVATLLDELVRNVDLLQSTAKEIKGRYVK